MRANKQRQLVVAETDPFQMMKQALVTEAPWESIVDFATHKSFCNLSLYPRQETLLKLIFLETENMTNYDVDVISRWAEGFKDPTSPEGVQQDIWERVEYLREHNYRRFPHIQLVMGRRASKGVLGGVLGTEQLAYMYSLDDWQNHYGLPPGKDGYLNCLATTQTQAKRFQFADIRSTVEGCAYLQPAISTSREEGLTLRTPSDIRLISQMEQDGIPIEREIASLRVIPMSSNSASGRGATSFGNIYDEMAHMISGTGSAKTSEETYEAYQPSLDQFGRDSLTMVPSSPWTRIGKFYELYKSGCVTLDEYNRKHDLQLPVTSEEERDLNAEEGLEEAVADPEMLVVQLPSWALYEDWEFSQRLGGPKLKRAIQYPPKGEAPENLRMARLEARNPEKFKVERRAQFAAVIDAYLNPSKVDAMFAPFWGGRVLESQNKGRMDRTYRIHIDPATTNANFALSIGHLEDSPEPDEHGDHWPHVIIDFLHVWKAEDFPDQIIDYTTVYKDITDILDRFPTTAKFSSDSWNSAAFLSMLKRDYGQRFRVEESNFSDKGNRERAEYFKSALNLGWVHCLAGETGVLTPEGVVPIAELAGGTHKVLTTSHDDGRGGGVWKDAEFRSFGVQKLKKITVRRNGVEKELFGTDGHRWFVTKKNGSSSRRVEKLTGELTPGDKLTSCYAQRHKQTEPSPFGVAHGFVFGDGTRSRKGSVAQFCGPKDEALLPYYPMSKIVEVSPGVKRALDLPRFFKEKVDLKESPSYLYGWLAGYFAADGHVTKDGRASIDSNFPENLEHVRAVCNLLGIHTTSIRVKPAGRGSYSTNDGYSVTLDRGALTEDFFIIEEHKQRFLDNQSREVQDYRGFTVVSVEETDREEEVYCAIVPGTHSFTLEDNILTGNCYKDSLYEGTEGSLLELELKFLSEKNGKVVKQETGPVQTKDLADTVMEVTVDLLKEPLDHWERQLLGITPAYGSTDVSAIRANRVPPLEQFSRPLSSYQGKGPMGTTRRDRRFQGRNPRRGRGW